MKKQVMTHDEGDDRAVILPSPSDALFSRLYLVCLFTSCLNADHEDQTGGLKIKRFPFLCCNHYDYDANKFST